MIPRTAITGWRTKALWRGDDQVEQDLVISRALIELFSDDLIAEALAFRGGTALNKLFLPNAARYSEDSVPCMHGGKYVKTIQTNRSA